jgi:hypothetical protein
MFKHILVALSLATTAAACSVDKSTSQVEAAKVKKPASRGVGLTAACDPIGTKATSSAADKGLNQFCDPIGTMYAGGSPLFDESTGRSVSLKSFLAKRAWARGLNRFCDPLDTVYADGHPALSNEERGLNEFCDAIGTMYAGGTPLFDESTGRSQTLDQYLAAKFVILPL